MSIIFDFSSSKRTTRKSVSLYVWEDGGGVENKNK